MTQITACNHDSKLQTNDARLSATIVLI